MDLNVLIKGKKLTDNELQILDYLLANTKLTLPVLQIRSKRSKKSMDETRTSLLRFMQQVFRGSWQNTYTKKCLSTASKPY